MTSIDPTLISGWEKRNAIAHEFYGLDKSDMLILDEIIRLREAEAYERNRADTLVEENAGFVEEAEKYAQLVARIIKALGKEWREETDDDAQVIALDAIEEIKGQRDFAIKELDRVSGALMRVMTERDTMRTALDGLKALRAVDPIVRDAIKAENDTLRAAVQRARATWLAFREMFGMNGRYGFRRKDGQPMSFSYDSAIIGVAALAVEDALDAALEVK